MVAVILISSGVALTILVAVFSWRRLAARHRDETPQERYRREMPNLQGGGIHPGGQPVKPKHGDNTGSGSGI
ncbi:hypothetical protein [Mycolicibacterium sphagni]|uniref:hypothetical protein n=1 Tax=Mycolicibacterium sphagni TaxID=1786 RepID=UPI0021F28476|nr:hypothetical protein [Mycolicibacterium sphagni]MCV7176183.1 hypothetical protein [Mycolicibacterium sphagni]